MLLLRRACDGLLPSRAHGGSVDVGWTSAQTDRALRAALAELTGLPAAESILLRDGDDYFLFDRRLLRDSATTTQCPWKGTAHYYTVQVGDARNEDAAWYYPDPKPAAAAITGRVAFWKGVQVTD